MTKIAGNVSFWQKNGAWTQPLTGQPILSNKRYQLKAQVDGNYCVDAGGTSQKCEESTWRYFQLQNEKSII